MVQVYLFALQTPLPSQSRTCYELLILDFLGLAGNGKCFTDLFLNYIIVTFSHCAFNCSINCLCIMDANLLLLYVTNTPSK